jgi:hypothetical protein
MNRGRPAAASVAFRSWLVSGLAAAHLVLSPSATASDRAPPAPADPLTVTIDTADADRFATLYARTKGKPTAAELQRDYIDQGSYGVEVFTPRRIVDGKTLAQAIEKDPESYARALQTCLPIVKQTTADLRAIYLAMHGLFPDRPLPHIYLVVGAGNSGGTAGPNAQVLGLEVLCRISKTPEELRAVLRTFYAHETVHVLQGEDVSSQGNILLASVLQEGAADFIAGLVTGRQPDPTRADWALPQEAALWHQFEADLATLNGVTWDTLKRGTPQGDAFFRWIGNAGDAPEGWYGEAGYWMGQRIWERWFERQSDKRAALNKMLAPRDPEDVLAQGRYRPL